MKRRKSVITGVGRYVPDYVLTNKELQDMVETSEEWIVERTGIQERHILKEPNKGSAFMGTRAVCELLERTDTHPNDVELLICSTVTPELIFPSTSNLVAHGAGLKNAYGFDMNAACSGFLYALRMGSEFVENGTHKKVIILGSDKMSSIVDYEDRKTCILFGDAAAAVMLEPSEEDLGVIDWSMGSDGSGEQYLHMKAGGSRRPASLETIKNKEHYLFQDGRPVFKRAVKEMGAASKRVMERNNISKDDIKFLVPHQANRRIIEATAKAIALPMDKVMINIHKYGNTTSATIPLCLYDYENQLQKGDKLILAAFGGGFTWGAGYLKWAY